MKNIPGDTKVSSSTAISIIRVDDSSSALVCLGLEQSRAEDVMSRAISDRDESKIHLKLRIRADTVSGDNCWQRVRAVVQGLVLL